MKRRRIPLTASGWTVAVLAAVAYVGGWQLGWVELMVVAAGCLHRARSSPLPFVVGRLALDVEPDAGTGAGHGRRPRRGRGAGHATRGARRSPRARSRSTSPGGRCASTSRRSAAGRATEAVYTLPTARRGVVTVGPALIVKSDLLGLMRREIVQTGTQTLWVHPRVTAAAGRCRSASPRTSRDRRRTPRRPGDVAFHALREYELGDDHRHIHWMSTARTGTLMVRHYVDNRRPNLTAVVDTEIDSYPSEREFDVAIEIAASLGVSSLLHGQPVAIWLDRDVVMGQNRPAGRNDLLDRLTLADGAAGTDVADAALHAAAGRGRHVGARRHHRQRADRPLPVDGHRRPPLGPRPARAGVAEGRPPARRAAGRQGPRRRQPRPLPAAWAR